MKNKIKYKAVLKEPVISKQEIKGMENFDKILEGSKVGYIPNSSLLKLKNLSTILGSSLLGIISFVLIFNAFKMPESDQNTAVKEAVILNEEKLIKSETTTSVKENVKTQKPKLTTVSTFKEGQKSIKKEEKKISKIVTSKRKQKVLPNKKKETLVTVPVKKKETKTKSNDSPSITNNAFQKAEPIDGFQELYNYLNNAVQNPEKPRISNKSGKVIIGFTIEKNGEISDIKVVKSIDSELDNEAVTIIKNMPKWKPALRNGKPVGSKLKIPFNFKVTKEIKNKPPN
eukprot:TRINITY_DN77268_c0_g1_i1.p1 TRINITY_DN77268_c0_g1~~TRINITY_DN77268_c0_g1_i1.p1  ORF type:complete len:286 (+),score=-48.12 TRINITY_DN77268_c0_g1_i1:751-1608(+)